LEEQPAIDVQFPEEPMVPDLYADGASMISIIETGTASTGLVKARMLNELRNEWAITYYETRPARLLYYTRFIDAPRAMDLTGKDDADTPFLCLGMLDAVDVFDPCMGRGLTAVSAEKLGMSSLGCELHPARVSCALHKLSRYGTPRKIGVLPIVKVCHD